MIQVACTADEAYLPHCAAMVNSLFACHEPAHIHVHLLHGPDLPATARAQFCAMVDGLGGTSTLHEMEAKRFADLPVMPRIPVLMWYRALLPELLASVDRIIYLDADTLVCDSLQPLWDLPLGGAAIAAVHNVPDPEHRDRPAQLGLPPQQAYFNSGVLLLDLSELRRLDAAAALLRYGRSHRGQLVWPDQDALNVVLGRRRLALHPRWNCQNSLYYFFERSSAVFGADAVREAVSQPAIVHFEGPALAKPWHYLCKHPERSRYWRHRRATPWADGALEERTWSNRLLKPLPMALLPRAYRAMDRWRQRTAVQRLARPL